MAVAQEQILEIFKIVVRYVPPEDINSMFDELENVKAAFENESYRETIRRLRACHIEDKDF